VSNGLSLEFQSPAQELIITQENSRRRLSEGRPFMFLEDLEVGDSSDDDENIIYWINMDPDIVTLINSVISTNQQNEIRELAQRLLIVDTYENSCISQNNAIEETFVIADSTTYEKRVGIPNKLRSSNYVCTNTAECTLASTTNWINCGGGSFNAVGYIDNIETIYNILKPFTLDEQRNIKSLTPPENGILPDDSPIQKGKFGMIWRRTRGRDKEDLLKVELFLSAYMGFKGIGPPLISGFSSSNELNIFMPAGQPLNREKNVLCCWNKVHSFLLNSASVGVVMLDLKLQNMLRSSIGGFDFIVALEDELLQDVSYFINAFMMLNNICAEHKKIDKKIQFVGSCTTEVRNKLYDYLIRNVNGITSKIDQYQELTKLYVQEIDGRRLNFWEIMYNQLSNYNSLLYQELNRLDPDLEVSDLDILDDDLLRKIIQASHSSIQETKSEDVPCNTAWKYVPIDFDPRFTTISKAWFYNMPSSLQQDWEEPSPPLPFQKPSALDETCSRSERLQD